MLRSRRWWLAKTALVVAMAASSACADATTYTRELSAPPTRQHWVERGFVEMVPALMPPTSEDGTDLIEVWLRLPEGAKWTVTRNPQTDAPSVRLPEGTEADRVELMRRAHADQVVDVRGTSFGVEGRETFRVLRPMGNALRGVSFDRHDPLAQSEADDVLRRIVRRGGGSEREVARLVALNQCASCHVHDKPESVRAQDGGRPNRRTDALGMYGILSVLTDAEPMERSRPRNRNLERPHVSVLCADGTHPRNGTTCVDGAPPRMRVDLRAALEASEPHALRVCASRRYLFARADADAKEAFAASFRGCGITIEEPLTEIEDHEQ